MEHSFRIFFRCLIVCAFFSIGLSMNSQSFVQVQNGRFSLNGEPYYYIGANLWYAPILGSRAEGGNRDRLRLELDSLKSLGVNNLRILVGAEWGSSNAPFVEPVLLRKDGTCDESVFEGLDYLLNEMADRGMVGVFYLTNAWDWSGGYGHYLSRMGLGDSPNADGDGWNAYCRYASQFYTVKGAQKIYHRYVRSIVSRRNALTGRLYADEPAIMAWQIANEPRPFLMERAQDMAKFLRKTSRLIKSIDKNHLVSIGGEGIIGCQYDSLLFRQISSDKHIDYITIHIWPKNWSWVRNDNLSEGLGDVFQQTRRYIDQHKDVAHLLAKPIVIEEFGYPRDGASYAADASVLARNKFYEFIFAEIEQNAQSGGLVAGCNFWGWGGSGRANALRWQKGDDFLCDPPHEPQGWYSVFDSDQSTCDLIRRYAHIVQSNGRNP